MAKISKAVKERKKDFAKTKLKVGKQKQAPANQLDTSFSSKPLIIPRQSVNQDAVQRAHLTFEHAMALLSHKSGEIRKDALQQLTGFLQGNALANPATLTPLMNALIPLMLDDTRSVRKALLELLEKVLGRFDREVLDAYAGSLLLYIASAMSHITPSIRSDSTKFLLWALEHTHSMDLILASHFAKFMTLFASLLGIVAQQGTIHGDRALITHLEVLETILAAALSPTIMERPSIIPQNPSTTHFVEHVHTRILLEPCRTLPLFSARIQSNDSSQTLLSVVLEHLSPLLQFLSDKFTDSVDGDKSLCTTVLRVLGTLIKDKTIQQQSNSNKSLKKIESAIERLREQEVQARTSIIIQQWRIIQDICA